MRIFSACIVSISLLMPYTSVANKFKVPAISIPETHIELDFPSKTMCVRSTALVGGYVGIMMAKNGIYRLCENKSSITKKDVILTGTGIGLSILSVAAFFYKE